MAAFNARLTIVEQDETTIIGRGDQLAAIHLTLEAAEHGVVTLRGPGGVGKTTLARSVAAERGAPFIELDHCRDEDEIASALGEGLGVAEASRTLDGVSTAVAELEVPLIVLDNTEHITARVAALLQRWRTQWATTFLVTSREPLALEDEHVIDITPLQLDDAVRLFEVRARESSRQFELTDENRNDVVQLIEQLDRLPLAIELAAARVKLLSPAQIGERLTAQFDILRRKDDSVPRHATLDACVQWSWQLLDDQLRDALGQLAIFRGKFTLTEAEAVVQGALWVGDALEELADRSLLWVDYASDGARFTLYDSVRRFVDRHTTHDDGVVQRYAQFYLERVVTQALTHRDHANVMHAFDVSIGRVPLLAVELLVEARQKLWRAGLLGRIFEMLERALAVEDLDACWRGALWMALASNHYSLMEYERMDHALDQAIALVEDDPQVRARRTFAHAMLLLAVRRDEEQRYDDAVEYYDNALAELDVLPPVQQAHLLAAKALSSTRRGRIEQALVEHERAIDAARRSQDAMLVARTLTWSSNTHIAAGQADRAIARLEEALQIYGEHSDVISRAVTCYNLAMALISRDRDRAIEMAKLAQLGAREGRLRILEASTDVLVERLSPTPQSPAIIRRAMRIFGADSAHFDRWSAWISMLVVLIELGEFDVAAQEAEFLVMTTERVAMKREQRWCRRYLVVIHAMRGELDDAREAAHEPEFIAAVDRAIVDGVVSDADYEAFDDAYLYLVHDCCPLPLDLLKAHLAKVGDHRVLEVASDGTFARLPCGGEVDLETRYVLRRLLLAFCASHDAHPGRTMTLDELIEVGWPDERMAYESGTRRVYSAIRNLRKIGFDEVLLTGENGYLIDPDVTIVMV